MRDKKLGLILGVLISLLATAGCSLPQDAASAKADDLAFGPFTDFRTSVPEFGEELRLIRATLSHNKVSFPGKTGTVSGFAAGSAYPQIWLRDAATIIPASRFFYEKPFLQSWLEEHLAFQAEDGGLEDWFDSRGKFDKNTTETDQETSAVRAAAQITEIIGPAWLEDKVKGETVLARLEKALRFVLGHRFDRAHGLVTGAHTADWGDVDIGRGDQGAIYSGPETHWTCDIYDQSEFHGAARGLAKMLATANRGGESKFWEDQAALIRQNADRWLWQADKGFYRVHLHLDSLRHPFDEDGMFALGGNTEAILSGLALEDQSRRIIESALARQKEFGISTISGTLLPPYPKGVFKHPMMDDPYEYQNGGQWDWFGAKLVLAMFEHGFSRQAKEKLLEIARKNIANKGLYEWDTPAGQGRGSAFYSGSAGSLARALFEGYYGIKIAGDAPSLAPRLNEDKATVHVYFPASGSFAAYDYQWDAKRRTVVFRFNSNISRAGTIEISMPLFRPGNAAGESLQKVQVRKDGVKTAFQTAVVGDDAFVVIRTDFNNHVLEVRF